MSKLSHALLRDQVLARLKASIGDPVQIEATRMHFELRSHIDNRAGAIERRLDEARLEEVRAIADHLPFLLQRLGHANALGRDSRRRTENVEQGLEDLRAELWDRMAAIERSIRAVQDRTEFVRREFMHELRYGRRTAGAEESVAVEVRDPSLVVDERGLVTASTEGPLRLNLGAGHIPLEGYVNCDGRALDGIDIVCDVRAVPVALGAVEAIHAAHLLEHFPQEEARRTVLPHWRDLLRPGGRLTVVVPDWEAMLSEHAAGRYGLDELRLVTFGEQEYDGDFHFNMFGREGLAELLRDSGFTDVALVETGRRNGVAYEMELTARTPAAPEQ